MKSIVVLSHLMSKNCVLGEESVARAKLAIETFQTGEFQYLVTSGWAYRSDSKTPISDVVADYIINNSDIDHCCVVSSPYSRDTVGDAYFARKLSQLREADGLVIVTSDYHVKRTQKIFKTLLSKSVEIVVLGAETRYTYDQKTLDYEEKSITAFDRTFKETNVEDIRSIYNSLVCNHPFYNGKIHSKIEFELEGSGL